MTSNDPAFAPPEGFIAHDRASPVTDPWQPIYARHSPGLVELGILVASAHCNGRGFLHGGVIATLADNAMGLSLVAAAKANGTAEPSPRALTLSMSVDYISVCQIGQFLTITPQVLKSDGKTGFVEAKLWADTTLIARTSATFRLVAG
jgi:acyl-coenzyme A thioesterase PaaI-like protein